MFVFILVGWVFVVLGWGLIFCWMLFGVGLIDWDCVVWFFLERVVWGGFCFGFDFWLIGLLSVFGWGVLEVCLVGDWFCVLWMCLMLDVYILGWWCCCVICLLLLWFVMVCFWWELSVCGECRVSLFWCCCGFLLLGFVDCLVFWRLWEILVLFFGICYGVRMKGWFGVMIVIEICDSELVWWRYWLC